MDYRILKCIFCGAVITCAGMQTYCKCNELCYPFNPYDESYSRRPIQQYNISGYRQLAETYTSSGTSANFQQMI